MVRRGSTLSAYAMISPDRPVSDTQMNGTGGELTIFSVHRYVCRQQRQGALHTIIQLECGLICGWGKISQDMLYKTL